MASEDDGAVYDDDTEGDDERDESSRTSLYAASAISDNPDTDGGSMD